MAMLRKESWLHLAKLLEPNTRKYKDHVDCGAGRTLVVSTGELGWSAHCFRCNQDGFEPYGTRNLAELQNVNYGLLERKDLAFEKGACVLPLDYTQEIPDHAALWLYKAGVFKSTAKAYGFGWSESTARVLLPVYEDQKGVRTLVFMQARSADGRKPKYLNNAAISKQSVLFKSTLRRSTMHRVVITEDILSSVRVGMLCASVSTLGTSLSDEQAYWLSSNYSSAAIWYDGDTAGIRGSERASRTLKLLGMSVQTIRTDKDPKCHSNREMRSILKESLSQVE